MKDFKKYVSEQGILLLGLGVALGMGIFEFVRGLVAGIIDPLIAWAFSTGNLAQQYSTLGEGTDVAIMQWGVVVTLAINLLVVVAVVYFAARYFGLFGKKKTATKKKTTKKK